MPFELYSVCVLDIMMCCGAHTLSKYMFKFFVIGKSCCKSEKRGYVYLLRIGRSESSTDL